MAQEDSGDIEYSILAYFDPSVKSDEETELVEKTMDMDAAFKKGEELSARPEYYKIEIRKKYQEPKTGRELDMVLKVFEKAKKKQMGLVGALVITLVCTAVAFGAAFVIGQMLNG